METRSKILSASEANGHNCSPFTLVDLENTLPVLFSVPPIRKKNTIEISFLKFVQCKYT
jgi:hypothetical protein